MFSAAPDPIDVVVKIGGSACTVKSKFETLNPAALNASAKQLATLSKDGVKMAVIHGAGSFGHQFAREYGISKGSTLESSGAKGADLSDRLREGFAKTRLSVTTLNHHVITALVKEGMPAVTVSACPYIGTASKKLTTGTLPPATCEAVAHVLSQGMVPVVHGDAVLDAQQATAIMSGDLWMIELCKLCNAKSAVFITDVDGVFTKPPTDPSAELVKTILVDPSSGALELTGVSMDLADHDVTGGLKAKLESAAEVLMLAPSVEAVYIVRAGSPSAEQALRGQVPDKGTTLTRRGDDHDAKRPRQHCP